MRKITITFIAAILAVLICSVVASAQTARPKPQWLKCPQCQTPEERAASRAKEEKLPFNPRDLTGIWNQNRIQLSRDVPPMTEWGKARYDATKTEAVVNGETVSNTKDPMLICDPDDEHFWPGQSEKVYDALPGPRAIARFTEEEGSDWHCEPRSPGIRDRRVFDWLDEALASSAARPARG